MSWMGLEGHDPVVRRFERMVAAGRLSSTFLFVGPPGIGKFRFALQLAQALLCQNSATGELTACGDCPACQQVRRDTHPDLIVVRRPEQRTTIPVELLIGDRQHRMREGLVHQIAMRPLMGHRKVAIIDDADYLNEEGANCLLKTLEEPPVGSVLILIGSGQQRQLPTIRSRAQIVQFQPLEPDALKRVLQAGDTDLPPERWSELVEWSGGRVAEALQLADPQLDAFRRQIAEGLSSIEPDWPELARVIAAGVEEAGKDASARRAQLLRAIGWTLELLRQQLRQSAVTPSGPPGTVPAPDDRRLERLGRQLERTAEAAEQVEANANLPTLIEGWVEGLRVS